jgi:methyl-accepting chemotaxis protein
MHDALHANPQLVGLCVVFEPDALDDKDGLFPDNAQMGGNDSGRFALGWEQPSPGQLGAETIAEQQIADKSPNLSGKPANDWYACARESAELCLVEPYLDSVAGRQMLVGGVAFPLLKDGKVLGVVGAKIDLSAVQRLSEQAHQELYGGEGQLAVISTARRLVGYSRDARLQGEPLSKAYPDDADALARAVEGGRQELFKDGGMLRVLSPLQIIPGARPWAVLLEVPTNVLLAPALGLGKELGQRSARDTLITVLLGLVAVTLGLLLMWLTARGVTRPILGVAAMLKDIASGEGDLTQRLDYSRRDELDELTGGFNRFLDKLQPTIANVKRSVQDTRASADQRPRSPARPARACSSSFARSSRWPPLPTK